MNDRIPYTYLIGWSKLDKWYYGVRFRKGCCPTELWVKYYTSSKLVKEYKKIYGDPDVIKIRKIFNSIDSARNWETKVLKRLAVVKNSKWLNQTDNISIKLDDFTIHNMSSKLKQKYIGSGNPFYGKTHTTETIKKMSDKAKKRVQRTGISEEFKNHWVGKNRSDSNKKNLSNYSKTRIWIVNKEGVLCHCSNLQDTRLLSGEFKLGRKWKD